jgi:hypothetical protein
MNVFWIKLTVSFSKPMLFFDEDTNKAEKTSNGFFQEIGCTGDSKEEVERMAMDYLRAISWLDLSASNVTFDRIAIIPNNELASEIYGDPDIKDSLTSDPLMKGIWYLSGKAFFSENANDDEFYQVKITKKGD